MNEDLDDLNYYTVSLVLYDIDAADPEEAVRNFTRDLSNDPRLWTYTVTDQRTGFVYTVDEQADPVVQEDAQFVLTGPRDKYGELLYWSNMLGGWATVEHRTMFTKTERDNFKLDAGNEPDEGDDWRVIWEDV